ncbi:FecR family protein [Bizionia gelidisalsuginis]|uniref:FecR family protein n=1 Tax=Bizionia gelidisalsuginis TaxID=291188 RepID=A0ABY3MAJ8_9FLAO|nr:FecR family protein [Bizionia gelidisalsuginis]TYC12803.1 FecR family protein [Bizionia gelidisalsuginis]
MKKEDLILKWLDNNLSPTELEAFKNLEDYEDLVTLSQAIMRFKTEDYNSDDALADLQEKLKAKQQTKQKRNWMKPILRIAAVLAIGFGTFYYTATQDTNFETLAAQKNTITLPDASTVTLNSLSSIRFNTKNWNGNREIKLNGEGYFKVAKGATFSVQTKHGIVTVLGTQFSVKERDSNFEVVCYEGSVSVNYNSDSIILKPTESFVVIDGERKATEIVSIGSPLWLANESTFKSMPLRYVIAEFERQYNVTVNTKDINTTQLFTGSFTHENINVALQAITLPLHLTFKKDSDVILLSSE